MNQILQNHPEYTHYCNLQMIILLSPENNKGEISRYISHTINAQHIWNKRLEGHPVRLSVWQEHDCLTLEQLERENYKTSIRLLNYLDLTRNVSYKDIKGKSFTKNIGDVFFHIINHSTYHRGQLMLELKDAGVTPISLDFIHYMH